MKIDESCVLIVFDAIKAYESMFSHQQLKALEETIDTARNYNCKIIFTQWIRYRKSNEPEDEIDKKGHWSFFIPNNSSDILFTARPNEEVIRVTHTNAFVHEEFCNAIPENKTLMFVGGWAESCVINSVRHALDKNYKTVVIKDACMGHFGARHHAFYVMQLIYTKVVNFII